MKLVVFTWPENRAGESHHLLDLFDAGLERLHVRKPGLDREQLKKYLNQIPQEYLEKVVLHSHVDLVQEYALMGAHGEISDSAHSIEEVEQAAKHLEYIFLSPIFESISKPGYGGSRFLESELRQVLAQTSVPVLALGGVTAARIAGLQVLGFSGVGVLGAIWTSVDPVREYLHMQSICHEKESYGNSAACA